MLFPWLTSKTLLKAPPSTHHVSTQVTSVGLKENQNRFKTPIKNRGTAPGLLTSCPVGFRLPSSSDPTIISGSAFDRRPLFKRRPQVCLTSVGRGRRFGLTRMAGLPSEPRDHVGHPSWRVFGVERDVGLGGHAHQPPEKPVSLLQPVRAGVEASWGHPSAGS